MLFSPPTHTSYYSSVEVEAILAKAKQIVIVPEYIKKSGACGGS